jgi:hypothetical protein
LENRTADSTSDKVTSRLVISTTRSFRPSGFGRYVIAAFLLVWLAGWAAGEGFALFAIAGILGKTAGTITRAPDWLSHPASTGAVVFIVIFLSVWLTFWTIGGVAAWTFLLRSLWGEDTIELTPSGFELVRRAGPFRRRYEFDRGAIRRVRLRPPANALVIDAAKGMRVLTTFGSPIERQEAADWLALALSLPDAAAFAASATPPATWNVSEDGDAVRLSTVTLRGRIVRSLILWLLAAIVATTTFAFRGEDGVPGLPALAFTLLFVLFAALSTWARREWIVRRGELTFERRVLFWAFPRVFRDARLDITHHTDTDNDEHYVLAVVDVHDGSRRRTVHSQVNDSGEVVDLGYWLAARTGFSFTPPR